MAHVKRQGNIKAVTYTTYYDAKGNVRQQSTQYVYMRSNEQNPKKAPWQSQYGKAVGLQPMQVPKVHKRSQSHQHYTRVKVPYGPIMFRFQGQPIAAAAAAAAAHHN